MRHGVAFVLVLLAAWSVAALSPRVVADPPAGSGSGSGSAQRPAPPDPTLAPKTAASFGGDPDKIRAYVDSVYAYGRYLYDRGDAIGAKQYWAMIQRNFAEAKDVNVLIANHLDALEKIPGKQGTDATFEDDPVPPAGSGSGVGSSVDPGEAIPPPVECDPPVATPPSGSGSGSGSGSRPGRDAEDRDLEAERKKNEAEAKKLVRHFNVKAFRFSANPTTSGSAPELFLSFECQLAPQHATIVFYAYTDKGKVFRAEPMFLGPEAGVTHKIAAACKVDWAATHGRMVAGRVELCCGKGNASAVVLAQDLNPDKAPKNWWKTEDITARFGFYRVGQHPEESNTLKRIYH